MSRYPSVPSAALGEVLDMAGAAFICSASYERRCLTIPLVECVGRASVGVVCQNRDVPSPGEENGDRIRRIFSRQDDIHLFLNRSDPIDIADEFNRMFLKLSQLKINSIFVDITCFTRESLLILLKLIFLRVPAHVCVKFLYNPAEDYAAGKIGVDKWLSIGVREIRPVLGYSGDIYASRPYHLVIISGFEFNRAARIIDSLEPARLTVGIPSGHSGLNETLGELGRAFGQRLERAFGQVGSFDFHSNNALLTKCSLERALEQFKDFNNVIVPMNTKISTVGVGLAAIENEEWQLIYSRPRIYNTKDYAIPSGVVLIFEVEHEGDGWLVEDLERAA